MSSTPARLYTRYFPYAFDPVGMLVEAGLAEATRQQLLQVFLPQRDYEAEKTRKGNTLDVDLRLLWQSLVPNQPLSHAAIDSLGLTEEHTERWKRIVDDIDEDGGYSDAVRHLHDVIHICMQVPLSEFVLEDGRTLLSTLGYHQ